MNMRYSQEAKPARGFGKESGGARRCGRFLQPARRLIGGGGLLALLACGPASWAGDASWTNVMAGAAGAFWGDANNWTNAAGLNALPDNGHAYLTAAAASYTVLYDSVQPAISNLTVQNAAPSRTDLVVSAPLTSLGGAAIRLRAGASVTVTNGGVWSYEGVNGVTDGNESMFSIRDGGELTMAGGVVAFTNLQIATASYANHFNVGYGSTGTLRVASGRLEYYERAPRAYTNNNRKLYIGRMAGGVGTLEVSGGSVLLGMESGGGEMLNVGVGGGGGPVGSPQGRVVVTGGELVFTNNNGWNLLKIGQNYGSGSFVVTNTGSVNLRAGNVSARVTVGASPYGYGLLRMDGGRMIVGDGVTIGYNNGYNGTVWATGVVEVAAGTLDAGSGFVVGYAENASGGGNGAGFATLTGGRVAESYWGVFVGRSRAGGISNGRMTVSNGLLDIVSSADVEATGTAAGGGAYSGLGVGVINFNEANATSRAWGELTVSGGGIITNAGVLVIGVNGGTGTLVQTGGVIRHAPTGAADRKFTAIGYNYGASGAVSGGLGTYVMTGGSFYTPNRAYVGGVPTNILSYARSGSLGVLKVAGGTFTVTNNTLTVGGNGAGTLTIGSGGVCFAKDIVLTNNTSSTLRFEMGPSGLGALTASGTLSIYPGAKLEVDSSAYQGRAVWVKLADCAARAGSFDPANITVAGQGVVRQDRDEDVWLYIQRGTLIGIN